MALSVSALPYRYLIGGLSVASDVPLRGVECPSASAHVVVCAQAFPDDGRAWAHEARRFKASPDRWLFEAEDGCRFLVEDGRTVSYEAPGSILPGSLANCFLQPVLGTIFHQRHVLALHASAVEDAAGAIGFLGERTAGKSTLAAWMQTRGRGFIADDICPVDVRDTPTVLGGFAYQKLSPQALRDIGGAAAADISPLADDIRGRVRVRVRSSPAVAQPLARAYVLRPGSGGSPCGAPSIETLARPAALEALVEHTYRRQYLRGLGRLDSNLRACAWVAERVPMHQVSFSHDGCDIHTLGCAILQHLEDTR